MSRNRLEALIVEIAFDWSSGMKIQSSWMDSMGVGAASFISGVRTALLKEGDEVANRPGQAVE